MTYIIVPRLASEGDGVKLVDVDHDDLVRLTHERHELGLAESYTALVRTLTKLDIFDPDHREAAAAICKEIVAILEVLR